MNKTYSVSYLGITNGELGVLTRRHKLEPTPPPSEKKRQLAQKGVSAPRPTRPPTTRSASRHPLTSDEVTSLGRDDVPGSFSLRGIVSRPRLSRPSTADSHGRSDASSADVYEEPHPIHRPTYAEVRDVMGKSRDMFLNDDEASFAIDDDDDDIYTDSMMHTVPDSRYSSSKGGSRPGTRASSYRRPWSGVSNVSSEAPLPSRLTSDVYVQDEGFKHTGHETIAHKLPARGFRNTSYTPARTLRMKRLKKKATLTEASFRPHAAMRGLKLKQKARPVPKSMANVYQSDRVDPDSVPFALSGEPAPAITLADTAVRATRDADADGELSRTLPLTLEATRRHITDIVTEREHRERNAKAARQYLQNRTRISPRSGAVTLREKGNIAAPATTDTFTHRAVHKPQRTSMRPQTSHHTTRSSPRRTRVKTSQYDYHGRPVTSRDKRTGSSPERVGGGEGSFPSARARPQTRAGFLTDRGRGAAHSTDRPKSARKELFLQFLMFKRLRDSNKRLTERLGRSLDQQQEQQQHNTSDDRDMTTSPAPYIPIDTVVSDDESGGELDDGSAMYRDRISDDSDSLEPHDVVSSRHGAIERPIRPLAHSQSSHTGVARARPVQSQPDLLLTSLTNLSGSEDHATLEVVDDIGLG